MTTALIDSLCSTTENGSDADIRTGGPTSVSNADGLSLSARTVEAFAWRLLSESSKLLLQLAVQITLARLLPVQAFGLLAVASLVVNLGSRISEFGTGPALIQRVDLTTMHIRTAFWLSIVCGTFVSGAIWLTAPFAAELFNAAAVGGVLRLIGLVFVIGGIGTTSEALLLRRMDYRSLLSVELVSYGVGYAVIGITLAVANYGVWALAWATIAQALLKSTMLLIKAPHPMRFCLARREAGQLLNFGVGVTLGRLASFAAQNADYFVVARWLGTTALGLYARAYQLMCLPIYQFSSILNSVLFSAYASVQTDSERLRRGYLGSVSLSAIVVFPTLTLMGVVAPELMSGVFGSQWQPAILPLQILCAGGACYCIYNLADSLVRAKGAVYVKSVYNGVYACCVFVAAVAGQRWGIAGVATGVTVATAIVYVLMADFSLRLTGAGWVPFVRAQAPGLSISMAVIVMAAPCASALRAAGAPPLLTLGCVAGVSVSAAVAVAFALPPTWLSPSVLETVAGARKYGLATVVAVRRRWLPDTA